MRPIHLGRLVHEDALQPRLSLKCVDSCEDEESQSTDGLRIRCGPLTNLPRGLRDGMLIGRSEDALVKVCTCRLSMRGTRQVVVVFDICFQTVSQYDVFLFYLVYLRSKAIMTRTGR